MKILSHRFQSFLLVSAVLSAASFVASPAQAAVARIIPCGGGGTYKIEGQAIYSHSSCAGAIIIPADVEHLGGGSFQGSKVTSVSFEAGSQLNMIAGGVFYNTPLASIVLPVGLQKIDNLSFMGSKLKHISIPGTVNTIGLMAFEDTTLETVVFESRIATSLDFGPNVFNDVPSLSSITFKGPSQLQLNTFQDATSVDFNWLGWSTTPGGPIVSFPLANTNPGDLILYPKRTPRDGVNNLPCSLGGTFKIQSGVVTKATSDCAGAISIPGTVNNISANVFQATDLETVFFESRVAADLSATDAFRNSSKLRSVTFTGPVVIGDLGESGKGDSTKADFNWSGWSLSEGGPIVTFPLTVGASSNVTLYPKWTRKNVTYVACSLGGTFRIVDNVVTSSSSDCAGQIAIPANVTEIAAYGLCCREKVTSIVFAANSQLAKIGEGAFAYLTLTSIVLPPGVTEIARGAFEETLLTSVSITGPIVLGDLGESGKAYPVSRDFNWSGWSLIQGGPIVSFPLTVTASSTVTLYPKWIPKDGITRVACSLGGTFRIFEEENRVTSSTEDCAGQVSIPSNVRHIGDNAFQNRNITSVVFEANSQLDRINSYGFANTKITSIDLPTGLSRIYNGAFEDTPLTSISIPGTVLAIETAAFNRTQLETVIFEPRITSQLELGDYLQGNVFRYLPTLRSVTFNGPISFDSEPLQNRKRAHNWVGWASSPGGAIVTYPLNVTASNSVILYPKFTANTYVVTYNSKGGTPVSPGSAVGEEIAFPTPPTRVGYTFDAWHRSGVDFSGGPVARWDKDSDGILYAKWNPNTYSVALNSKGGSAVSAVSFVTDGAISTAPAAPSRAGYSFTGWSAGENGTALSFPYSPGVMENITLYAQWEKLAPVITAGPTPNSRVVSIPAGFTEAVMPATATVPSIRLGLSGTGGTAVATVAPSVNPAAPASTPFEAGSAKIVDINITGITGSVTICIDGAATDSLFHFTGGKWEELPQRSYANGQVCGVTSSFSPFTAAPRKSAAAPTNLSVTRGDKSLAISFTPGANYGAEITRYEFSLDNGKTWARVPGGDVKSPVTIAGLTNGSTYSVQLRAVNSAGSGADSAAVSGKPREPLLADSRGTDVPIVKDPALTFALNSDIAVRGNKVAVALVAPTSAKSKVSYYMFTMKPKTKGAATVKQTYKAKAKGATNAILTGKPKVTYTVSVTAIYANGSRKSWTGPSLITQ
jgi:uncharacterized repeat protein (TIGR02543 family)